MRLVVKGNRAEALQACAERRIPAVPICGLFNNTQYVLACPNRHERKAQTWFTEWRETLGWFDNYGYPTGTLLWYDTPREVDHENVNADHEIVT